jgi:hypothetical protein
MGIDVELQDEAGSTLAKVGDPGSVLKQALPDVDDASFACLRFIDPYGDAVFNGLQVKVLIDELQRVRPTVSVEAQAFLDEVARLAHQASAEPHVYLKFIGD